MTAVETSCIIPVRNGARYIGEAIRSVLDQTKVPDEIIVVDDGSTDDTGLEAAKFGSKIDYLKKPHAGVAAARNDGIARSRGNLICFLDADDRMHPKRLALQLDQLGRHPAVELCDAHSTYFWSEEISLEEREEDHRYLSDFWHDARPGHITTWLVRRSTFDRVGLFDPMLRFSEDTDWLLRFRDGGGIETTIPRVLSYRRLHRDNVTAGSRQDQVRCLAQVLKRSRDRRAQGMAE
jgi:glycosyltransferase involved in cell wall biosynthesis